MLQPLQASQYGKNVLLLFSCLFSSFSFLSTLYPYPILTVAQYIQFTIEKKKWWLKRRKRFATLNSSSAFSQYAFALLDIFLYFFFFLLIERMKIGDDERQKKRKMEWSTVLNKAKKNYLTSFLLRISYARNELKKKFFFWCYKFF